MALMFTYNLVVGGLFGPQTAGVALEEIWGPVVRAVRQLGGRCRLGGRRMVCRPSAGPESSSLGRPQLLGEERPLWEERRGEGSEAGSVRWTAAAVGDRCPAW
jgi:hypothetical protein